MTTVLQEKEIMIVKNKGSQWRKWDLHFHTQSSYDYENKEVSNQQIIDKLSENGISVIAITDHHIIDVIRINDLKILGKDRNITVLPGIEFLSDTRGNEPVHFIGIFSEKADINYIWKQLESKTNICEIEGKSKKSNEVYCNLLETSKLIRELGGIVTIHAGKKTNSLENITNSLPHGIAQKEDIAKAVDIFEIGKIQDLIDYEQIVNKYLMTKIDKKLPLIICSDNHNVNNYILKQNLWIKAEPNFEGLKQIIYEPEHRVKIQADEPDYKDDKLVINSVNFICKKSIFPTETIYFNRNLNVIIGGKSSGKSILLYCIAKTLLSNREILKSEGKRELTYKYEFDTDFDFEVEILAGIKQSINRDDNTPSILSEIKYIPQNYLSKLAEPDAKKGNELRKLVRELLLEDETYKFKYDKFINQVKANDKKREILINDFFDLKDKIKILEGDLILKGNENVLLSSITSNDEKVKKLKESIGLTAEQINEYDNYNTELVETENSFNETISDFEKITNFNSEYIDKITELVKNKDLILTTIKNVLIKEAFIEEYKDLNNIASKIDNLNKKLDVNNAGDFLEENIFKTVIESLLNKKEQLVEKLKPLLKDNEIKKQIEDIEKIISIDKQKLNQISQLKENIKKYKDALNNQKLELFKLYEDNYEEYQKIIYELDGRTSILNGNKLKIEGKVKFNFPKFRKRIQEISDSRSASYSSYSILRETYTGVSECKINHILSDLKSLFSAIVEDNKYTLLSKTDSKNAIKELFEDYFFDYWEVSYDNDMLYRMSTGKASFVILMLIIGLSKSKAPILIDQPEDNLDNRSITKDLVTYLRDKKLERQIILVTHNPNVVVNADAENIIIANQKGQNDRLTSSPYQFDYINGAIENAKTHDQQEADLLKSMGIREHVADIVEGGKEAFKKREKKYGF